MASPDAFIVVVPADNQFVTGAKTYDMVFHTQSSEQSFVFGHSNMYMKIASNGFVGVGVSNPVSMLQVAGDILPAANIAYDLGSSNLRFRDLYLSGSTIDLGGLQLSRVNGGLGISDSSNNEASIYFGDSNILNISTLSNADIEFGGNIAASNLNVKGDIYRNGNLMLPGDAPFTVDDSDTIEINEASNVSILKNQKLGQALWAVSFDSLNYEIGTKVVSDSEGNVYISGYYNNYSDPITIYNAGQIPSSVTLRSVNSSFAVFLIKFNSKGVAQWAVSVDGPSSYDSTTYTLAVDKDHNVYISGTYSGNLFVYDQDQNQSPTVTMLQTSNDSVFLVKYNSSGISQWGATFDTSTYSVTPSALCVDKDNFSYLAISQVTNGTIYNSDKTSSGLAFTPSPGTQSCIIIKYDSDGFAQSVINITRSDNSKITDIQVDDSKSLYCTFKGNNSFNSDAPLIYNSDGSLSPVVLYVRSSALIKFDANGTSLWASTLFNSITLSSQLFNSLALDKFGNIYVSGNYSSQTHQIRNADNTISTISFPANVNDRSFLIKFNADGISIWATRMTANISIYGDAVIVSDSGHAYLCGRIMYYQSPITVYDSDNTVSSTIVSGVPGDVCAYTVAFDENGHAEWAATVSTLYNSINMSACIDANGDIYVAGCYMGVPTIFNGDNQQSSVAFAPTEDDSEAAFIVKFSHYPVYRMTSTLINDGTYKYFINASENVANVQIVESDYISKINPYSSLQMICYDSVWYDMSVKSIGYTKTSNLDQAIYVDNHLLPSKTLTYDLGSSNLRFKDLYLSGSTIDLGGVLMKKDVSGGLRILNEATSCNETLILEKIILSTSGSNQLTLSIDDQNTLSLVSVSNNVVTSNAIAGGLGGGGWSNFGSNVYLLSPSNVGIGTIYPEAALHVTSDVKVGGSINCAGLIEIVPGGNTYSSSSENLIKSFGFISKTGSLLNGFGVNSVGVSLTNTGQMGANAGTFNVSIPDLDTSNYALLVTPVAYENGSNISYRLFHKTSSNFKVQLYDPSDEVENPSDWSFSLLKN